jgi:hypothetical protein
MVKRWERMNPDSSRNPSRHRAQRLDRSCRTVVFFLLTPPGRRSADPLRQEPISRTASAQEELR